MNDTPIAPPKVTRRRKAPEAAEKAPAAPLAEAKPEAAAPAAPPAASERPPVRAEMRPSNPRAEAEERARQILEHGGLGDMDGTDEYYIPKGEVPDGWTYEWKRNTVYGMADPAYDVQLAKNGWTPVPAARHPDMMPAGWSGNTITRKGQILMERPQVITDMVEAANRRRAQDQVRVKVQQLQNAPSKDQLPRAADVGGDRRTAPVVSKGYEPMIVPSDNK